eukprot:GHRQ01030120.1.p1 GENE.GHRQ01030120.1~~GHRQ01030120.1.p1  ORF type:complete len:158 (-),score=40.78 GHRQ01030120.1:606-1079(-)
MLLLHVALLHQICRGTETYLTSTSPNYQESVFQMVQHTLTGDYDELNMIPAVKLMEVVLQNCPGKVCASCNGVSNVTLLCLQCDVRKWLACFSHLCNAVAYQCLAPGSCEKNGFGAGRHSCCHGHPPAAAARALCCWIGFITCLTRTFNAALEPNSA